MYCSLNEAKNIKHRITNKQLSKSNILLNKNIRKSVLITNFIEQICNFNIQCREKSVRMKSSQLISKETSAKT